MRMEFEAYLFHFSPTCKSLRNNNLEKLTEMKLAKVSLIGSMKFKPKWFHIGLSQLHMQLTIQKHMSTDQLQLKYQ